MVGQGGPGGGQQFQYWPFSSSDLYNWRTQNSPFSEDPKCLIDLLESIMHTHHPTWDDCHQLLNTLFTTEERERILNEARKNVLGDNGRPTTLQPAIDEAFPHAALIGISGPQKVGSVSESTARLLWPVSERPLEGPPTLQK
jgi:hypothetical protein